MPEFPQPPISTLVPSLTFSVKRKQKKKKLRIKRKNLLTNTSG